EKGFDDAGFPRRRGYLSQDRAAHLEHAITTIFLTQVYDLCQVSISRFFKISYLGWSVPGDRRVLRPTATSAGSSDTGMARVGFRPRSVLLSTLTRDRLPCHEGAVGPGRQRRHGGRGVRQPISDGRWNQPVRASRGNRSHPWARPGTRSG